MRKCLVFGVVLILTLSTFPIYAFADDDPGELSPGDRYATEEELQELDSDLYSTAESLYSLVSLSDSRATEKTITDIYNWLNSYFGTDFGNHGSTYPDLVYSRLEQIRQLCNTINTSCNALVVKLTQFYNSINPDYETVGISIYDQLSAIATALTSVDSTDGDLTIVEILLYMHSELEDINTNLSAILNSSYSIDSQLVSILSYLVNFRSDMNNGINTINTSVNTGFTNVNANMALMISRLQSIQTDFNNITWTSFTPNVSYYYSLEDAISSSNPINSNNNTNGSKFYIRISNLLSSNNSAIYKLLLPFYNTRYTFGSFYRLNLYTGVGTVNDFTYCYLSSSSSDSSLLYLSEVKDSSLIIELSYLDTNFVLRSWSSASGFYISFNNIDFYTIHNYITSLNLSNSINKFVDIYASDDLIAAKEDQQGYEDQAIEDFTGSGSAAAKGSDLTDMKSISGALKNGLQSGGSVNNALAPFNTNSGFWGWFSQNNYDNINNIPSSGLRGGHNNEPEIIDFYNNNQITLHGLLGGSN